MLPLAHSRLLSAWAYRFCAPAALLLAFLGMSYLYAHGDGDLYESILTAYGVVPFQFPFVDVSGSLAAWECTRHGIDVILSDPCDVLHRGYTYSPLWLAAAGVPLNFADTTAVGWTLDLLFILSLALLPPPKCRVGLLLVLAATLSSMVVFALERANPDIMLFMMSLAVGLLAEGRLAARLLGYGVAVLAALLKYYPIMALIIVFRERIPIFLIVVAMVGGSLAVFWAEYHVEIARGLPNIPHGPYNTDLFAAKNLPLLLGEAASTAARSPSVGRIAAAGLFTILAGACVGICRKLLATAELRPALAALPQSHRISLVIGSAVISGCFFAGQSIGYRGVFLLMVVPGLLTLSRSAGRGVRGVSLATSVVIVLLMWGECLRVALYGALEQSGIPELFATEVKFQFWLMRELCWWWAVSVMLAVLADFLRDSPVVRCKALLWQQLPERSR
jgi:hypothetical protein